MSEQQPVQENNASSKADVSTTSPAGGYVEHVRGVLADPDAHFADSNTSASRINGLISLGLGFGLLYLNGIIGQVTRFSSWRFEFGFLVNSFKTILTIAIPVAVTLFLLHWLGRRGERGPSLDLLIARYGAWFLLPAALVALAIPLNLFDIVIHGWLRGGALVMIWNGLFLMSYWYAAPGRLRPAVLASLGAYLGYRLLIVLF